MPCSSHLAAAHDNRGLAKSCREGLRKFSGRALHLVDFLCLLLCEVSRKDLERSREEPSDLIVCRRLKMGNEGVKLFMYQIISSDSGITLIKKP